MYNWIDICYGIGCRDLYPFSFSSTSHLLTMSSLTFYTFLCPSFIFPPFLTFTYVYLFVTFDLLLISPFYTSSMFFFTLLFFPSYFLPFPASLFVLPLILSPSLPSSLPSTILILHYLLSFLFFLLPESQSSFSPLLNTYTCYQQWF